MASPKSGDKRILFLSTIDVRRGDAFDLPAPEAMRLLGENSGNLAFTSAIQHYLDQAGTPYDVIPFTTKQGSPPIEWDRYDACIMNVANWLAPNRVKTMEQVARTLKGVKVPTFMIGLGAQAPKGAGPEFVNAFASSAKQLLAALLETGGGFGLRGEFTGDCFDLLGFKDHYTVTGCPSFFQRGDALAVADPCADYQDFRPVMNGEKYLKSDDCMTALLETNGGCFICQDTFMRILHYFDDLSIYERRALLTLPEPTLRMLAEGRVHLFGQFDRWIGFLRDGGFNFSLGSRVHGNVMAMLSGIPCLFDRVDSRTGELVDFFSLPHHREADVSTARHLYDIYCDVDYSGFRKVYPSRLENFRAFLSRHELPMKAETDKIGATFSRASVDTQSDSAVSEFVRSYIDFDPVEIVSPWIGKRAQFIAMSKLKGQKLL